ncbi:MAG TPA: hypothetical protein VFT22_08740 [Kofleriaceae bacterium]|nr:hypothetical protein [Kofleriaceae bacterium]
MAPRRMLLASLLFGAACSAAYADQPVAGPALSAAHIALDIAPPKIRAPYDVQILRENGEPLPTYAQRGRYYVQGIVNERYVIRIANPTSRRIEAVVSVDGLDAIDGENGDLRKRGYVVPPYGETRIEGFRTSQADVATFRFSSVSGSYAGQKGKARNVGVIAVALFEEQVAPPEQEIIVGQAAPGRRPYGGARYGEGADDRSAAPSASRDAARAERTAGADRGRGASPPAAKRAAEAPASAARPAPAPAPSGGGYMPPSDSYADDDEMPAPPAPRDVRPQRERLGLGTEFGEQRYSAASYTRFVRAPGRPVAIAELRYNDMAGLMALGIPVQPLPDAGEIMTRETADPFPGDRFAQPPR